ncbi:hypothetical protein [Emticicia sp. 17c]|uniref:hypothetical protein n=1 Tax=Emticicia sp. 17c TaxID=3127704 RepID=UPI00301D190B
MKKLIILLITLLPIIVVGQTDSVKVSFSEESVTKFEKTTLIDEYEKAFGNNRVVKSAFRIGPANANMQANIETLRSIYPFVYFAKSFTPIFEFEQKIGIDKSFIVSYVGRNTRKSVMTENIFTLETRWYYEMKKRVAEGRQKPNITGKYLSLKALVNLYDYISYSSIILFKPQTFFFRPTSSYSVNWGWQFGNNVNFGFSAGLLHGNKAGIDQENGWLNEKQSNKKDISWFISSNARAGLGLYLPMKKKIANNTCDFLQCNYEVNQLLKVNLANAFYLDKYQQQVKLDVAYERKIGHSPLSVNSNITGTFSNYTTYTQTGMSLDTTYNSNGDIQSIISYVTYKPDLKGRQTYVAKLEEQLRYYIGMNKRVARGQSASNLNGFYVGLTGSYQVASALSTFIDFDGIREVNGSEKQINVGLMLGYQVQTNRKSFIDVSTSILRQKIITPVPRPGLLNTILDFSLKLGFAR